jgi:hypothetical protein
MKPFTGIWTLKICVVALAVVCLAGTSKAAWEGDEKPEFGNAYTLQAGEWQVGLLRPTSVGLTDRLQLSTVLLGNLLGIVNAEIELTMLDMENFALSISGAGMHSFGPVLDDFSGAGGDLTATVAIGKQLLVSASGGYFWISDIRDNKQTSLVVENAQGITFGGEVDLLLNPHNILVFTLGSSYDVENKKLTPLIGGAFYAHCWGSFRLMAGFLFRVDSGWEFKNDEEDSLTTPILPAIDF